MATYDEQRTEIEPEILKVIQGIKPENMQFTLKNLEQIQMCLYAALAATEEAVRMFLNQT